MNIIVTGASSGIGFELVKIFCQSQHRVLAIARNEEKLNHLQSCCAEDSLIPVVCDITQPDNPKLKTAITSLSGSIDVVINNAGLLINKPFMTLNDEDWQQTFEVNVFGVVRFLQFLHPFLNRRNAHIVNIGSMGGFMGSSKFSGLSAYSAAKGALAILTECLAEEWKQDNIRVNCLALGAVQTDMLSAAFPNYQAPLKADEMAEWIAYFALNGDRFFNGKILPVSLDTP